MAYLPTAKAKVAVAVSTAAKNTRLFDQAVNFVTQKRKASTAFSVSSVSAITVRRVHEQMEAQGIVSAQGITVIVEVLPSSL